MATQYQNYHFTPTTFLYFILLSFSSTTITTVTAVNITDLLSTYPSLSSFTSLLSSTAVAADLSRRSSLTLLAVPNSFLATSPPHDPTLPDILRYHVLLQYLTVADLRLFPAAGKLVTTLYQTTGRAAANSGAVNISYNPNTDVVEFHTPTSNATLISAVKSLPYNFSILTLNSLLIPYNLELTASETRPDPDLNITSQLINGHNFNVAASMLSASGVVSEFEADEIGAGITLFIPTDEAFADLPSSVRFQSLPADRKAVVLRFHVLHSYYPLGSLESIVNPVQPTLATEQNGAGRFTLNISRVNGSVGIDTGIVQASIMQTVFDQNPVAIFGVSRVLLPKEYFGSDPVEASRAAPGELTSRAEAPSVGLAPEYSPPSHLTAEAPSGAVVGSVCNAGLLLCIGFCYYYSLL